MDTRSTCAARDASDPLAPLRLHFALDRIDEQAIVYLDGNSLGVLPKAAVGRVREVVEDEWGVGLIRSWNAAGWIALSQRVADKIARLIGARAGEVVVADSTSVNLYKVLCAAVALSKADAPHRRTILSERGNFPTDLYIAESVARAHGLELVLVDADEMMARLDERVAMLLLTHVDYRTGRRHRMREVTRAAHDAGALMIWDLAHSAGAMPVEISGAAPTQGARKPQMEGTPYLGPQRGSRAGVALGVPQPDFAVGCGYKYLNGGPGAPAFAWVHPRHLAWMNREGWRQPLSGWMGHAAPFAFAAEYQPATGMSRFLCGTPPVLSLAALDCGVDTVLAAEGYGGLDEVRRKSIALTELFIELVESRCAGHGLMLVTPRDPDERGSQVSFAHPDGYAIVQALIARGAIGDFRAPDIMRFGVTPLYTRFVDVWDAVDRLHHVLATGEWRDPRFRVRATVT